MGYYINIDSKHNNLPARNKVQALVHDGAIIVPGDEFLPNMICVVENPTFDAAAYIFSEAEHMRYYYDSSGRKATFLQHPYARQLSGYLG